MTHDQEEALTLSDRIAVFNNGRIEQLGTPEEIYEAPMSPFVASFVGTSNIFDDAESNGMLKRAGTNSVRPEKIALHPVASKPAAGVISLPGTIAEVIYLGTSTRLLVELAGGKRLTVLEQNISDATRERRDERVIARFSPADIVSLEGARVS